MPEKVSQHEELEEGKANQPRSRVEPLGLIRGVAGGTAGLRRSLESKLQEGRSCVSCLLLCDTVSGTG